MSNSLRHHGLQHARPPSFSQTVLCSALKCLQVLGVCVELLNATKTSFFTSRQFMLEPLLFGFYKWQKSNLRSTETDTVDKGDSLDLPSLWATILLEYLGLAMVSSQLKCLSHNPQPPTQTHTRGCAGTHGLNHLRTLCLTYAPFAAVMAA